MKEKSKSSFFAVTKRFVVLGSLNTALTYVIFIALSFLFAPALAYSIAFLVGLLVVTINTNKWVFKGKDTWPRRFVFLACYLTIFLFGQWLIALMKPVTVLELLITSGGILGFSIPVIILCGQRTFRPSGSTEKNTVVK